MSYIAWTVSFNTWAVFCILASKLVSLTAWSASYITSVDFFLDVIDSALAVELSFNPSGTLPSWIALLIPTWKEVFLLLYLNPLTWSFSRLSAISDVVSTLAILLPSLSLTPAKSNNASRDFCFWLPLLYFSKYLSIAL